ncbi:MAG TPA: POTRA domain-containing protein [Gemmataceae bacterium]
MDKLKTIAVLLSSFLVLGIGVGAWRHSASAGQGPESQAEKPVLPTRDMKAPAVPAIPSGERTFQIDLSIVRWRDEERKVTDASLRALEGKTASFAKGQDFWVEVGGGKVEKVVMGPSVRVVVRRNEDGRVRLDMTVSQTANGTFGEEVMLDTKSVRFLHTLRLGQPITTKFWPDGKDQPPLEVTAAVRETKDGPANGKTIAEAEKSLKLAEFYQRSGHADSARFYYELICRRYPDTLYAERAKERLAEEKPLARVGQVFIIGNKKIADAAILEQVPLFPGQILSYPDVAAAEKRLSRLKGLKGRPKVTVIDREGDGAYKDIQITVEEK